jgi:hypothetical protein
MASATQYFDHILTLCQATCESVTLITCDERSERALLNLTARYGDFDLYVSEIVFPNGSRKYAYYVLHHQKVIVGFDNAPDPEVLKLKYGVEYARHRLELLPHAHSADKMSTMLTEVMDFEQFLVWVQANLPL